MPGYGPRPVVVPTGRLYGPELDSYASVPEVNLATALKMPEGSRVRVKAELLLADHEGVRLCDRLALASNPESDAPPACSGTQAKAVGLTWSSARRWTLHGPFSARVSDGGLSEVTSPGYYTVSGGVNRSRWYDWDGIELEGSLSSSAAVGSGSAFAGGEGSLDARITPWSAPSHGLVRVARGLVGDDLGLALRGRWLVSTASGGSELLVGVAPFLSNADTDRQWSYPSLLGLFVPEVGVGFARSEAAFPYLGWSIPVGYHFESHRYRRHPYDASDVLGLRLAPAVLVSFRGTADVLYGIALGVSAW